MEFCSEVTTLAFVIVVTTAGVPVADFSTTDFLPVLRETDWNGIRDIKKARFSFEPFSWGSCCWSLLSLLMVTEAEELVVIFSLLLLMMLFSKIIQ